MCAAWIHMSIPPSCIITRERQRPRWLLSACLGAEEDLVVPEKGVSEREILLKFRHAHKSLLSGNIHLTSRIMAATIEDLKKLPVSEKIQLVEDLWDSIAAETSPIGLSSQHIAELDHRLDALEKNPRQGTPWSAVREKILAVL